ncbi:MAG: hypothetical protein HY049_06365 [Acidobacteria bacterium]|nr:hypothetical protein [Acidobacteriota bacterium]
MRERRPALVVAAILLAMPLAVASVTFGEEPAGGASKKAAAKPADPNAPKVFTNRDLSKYHSSATGPRTVYVDTTAKADATAAAPDESLTPDEKARRLAEIQNGIKEGEARAVDLDKRLAFMANPYLPPPQLTPDEIAAQKGMSQKDAYQALQAEKAALVEKLTALRADLAKVSALPTRPGGATSATSAGSATTPEP